MLRLKRVYEAPAAGDGARVLVERLWPRGVSKAALGLDAWARDAAPTARLRVWFSHDPARWAEFRRRYFRELDARPAAWRPLVERARRRRVTLLFSSRDETHNNAVALKEYLERRLRRGPRGARAAGAPGRARARRPAARAPRG